MADYAMRRKYLINKPMQLKYVGMLLITIIAVNLIVGFGIFFTVWATLKTEYSNVVIAQKIATAQRMKAYEDARLGVSTLNSGDIDKEANLLSEHLLSQLKESFDKTKMKIIPVVILLLVVIFLEGIFLSNRIAGPIYHAEKSLKQIREGDLTVRTFFRKHDEFKDLYEEMNLVASRYEETVLKTKGLLEIIKKSGLDIKADILKNAQNVDKSLVSKCDEVINSASECAALLATYRTKPRTT